MLGWLYEDFNHYKTGWLARICAIGMLVLTAGCHSFPESDGHIDSPNANPKAVSVFPASSRSSSTNANSSGNEFALPTSLPLLMPVPAQHAIPLNSSGPIAKASNSADSSSGKNPESIGTSVNVPKALDLGLALRLAGIDNPTINLAQERIREALGQQANARVLLLPNLNVGGNYHYNNGPIQSSTGEIVNVANQALYLGGGAGVIGSSTVAIPGIWLFASLGDAVYEPLVAQQNVSTRRSDYVATQNTVMGDVVTAYLRLVGCEARLDVLRQADVEGAEVVRLTTEYAKAGQGRLGDANRSKALNDLVERDRRRAEEEVEVASTQLCRLLNLDPSNHLRTPNVRLETFRLISEDTDAEELIAQALRARPELAAGIANIQVAQTRVRQEKVRPFLPTLSLGVSTGAFGGGSDLVTPSSSQLAGRTDIDLMAVWNLQNLGFGNRARAREANAVVGQALAEYQSITNRVRREVLDAVADARAAARQLDLAQAAVSNSTEGFRLDLQRIKGGAGAAGANDPSPIELLDSFQEILDSRQSLVSAVMAFDIAQYRLFVAIGNNPVNGPDVSRVIPTVIAAGPVGVNTPPLPSVPPPIPPSRP